MKTSRILPYLIAAILVVGIFALKIYIAQSGILTRAEYDITNGNAILINDKTSPESLSALLISRKYITTEAEARFMSDALISRIQNEEGMPSSLRDLGDKRYGIQLDSAGFAEIAHFPHLNSRAEQLAGGQGVEADKLPQIEASISTKYSVKIRNDKGRIHRDTVFLCVKEHYNESVQKNGRIIDCQSRDSIYACIPICGKTDIWLPVKGTNNVNRYFSVVPVERGFVFGSSMGTYRNSRRAFNFVRKRAVLPIFSRTMLKQMRDDNSILIRSPKEYKEQYISVFALFASLWLLAYLVLTIIDKRRSGNSNLEILIPVIILSGLGLVNLFNLQNPLWGELYACKQLRNGFAAGIAMLILFAFVDWINLYRFSYKMHLSSGRQGFQGLWMALGAIIIALILLMFGYGPGGTHVTLPLLNIQGSPMIKMLFIGYLAVVFASRNDLIEAYTKPGKIRKQIMILLSAILTLSLLGFLQLMISDLGPFLVIAITSIIIFSLITKETISMLAGTGIFCIVILVLNRFILYSYLPFIIFTVFTVIWSIYSYNRHERIKLSPIILSLVILMIFHGGTIFNIMGMTDIAERLDGRTEIAVNTFDNEVVGGSQIAEGIWAVSRGGMWGNPKACLSSTLPAGHTDLAFVSLCENMGLFGGLGVIILLGIFLFIALKIGVRNGHPLGFALSSLIALSIGVQTVLIILGSLGVIPLTGVTLNFISYGGTALVLDIACVGILISLSRHKDYQLEVINTQKYEPMSRGQLWAYVLIGIVAIGTIFNYGLISRKEYLIKPGKFINNSGERIVLVNPLINSIQKQIESGDIFDRHGNVMASTDDTGARSYPYGDHTLMTLGDLNTKTLWGTAGKRPAGLLAEERFQSTIRGYDTRPMNVSINSSRHHSRFLPDVVLEKRESVRIEDFSALLPLMTSDRKLKKWNEQKEKRNIQLTVDAELQKALSESAEDFVQRNSRTGKTGDRTRVSIVAMDAEDGSLLASAMYPLPNQDILRELTLNNITIYRDWTPGFKAYTEMDLGLSPSAPGSTIKLISAGAGISRFSVELATEAYNQYVHADEIVDITLGEPTGNVSLETAISQSSNVYFIKLINQYGSKGLYPELASLYYAVGAGFGTASPYVLYPDQYISSEDSYTTQVEAFGKNSAHKFSEYLESGQRHRLIDAEYQPSWGQGQVTMSPISLCRFVAAIANNGKMMYPRYVESDSVRVYKELFSEDEAELLQACMKKQAERRFGEYSSYIGGKTGTPTRTDRAKSSGKSNDALYCFFVDAEATKSGHPLAVVIRLERVNDFSRLAIKMADEVVIPILREKGYID